MARSWRGTWLSAAVAADVRMHRLFHLATVVAGIHQKPCASLAWDVQWSCSVLADCYRKRADAAFLGATLILLRQVFAKAGQGLVGTVAAELLRAGRPWDKAAIRSLHGRLSGLDPADAGRTRGRLVQYSGPAWCRKLLASRRFDNFRRAGAALGRILRSPAVAGDPSEFAAACAALDAPDSRLPGFGRYSRASAIRVACCSRLLHDKVRHDVSDDAWSKQIRGMHALTVTPFFDAVGVLTVDDAKCMLRSVANVLREQTSFRTAAKLGKMTLADLALQACEATSILKVVARHIAPRSRPGLLKKIAVPTPSPKRRSHARSSALPRSRKPSRRDVVEWVLKRLPRHASGLAKLSKTLRLRCHRQHRDTASNPDTQASAAVTRAWLETEPSELKHSLWTLLQPRSRPQRLPWSLPILHCPECGRMLDNANHRHKRRFCDACAAEHRRAWDRDRRQSAVRS